MGLSFYPGILFPSSRSVKKTLVFLLMLGVPAFYAQKSVTETRKEADKLFEDEEFTAAYKLYSQLVSNYPKEPEYNFRLGVCMIFSEPDKKKCLQYLKFAAGSPKEVSKDLFFYLGKAYHINYLFDEAIRAYSEFKSSAPASRQKKFQVDREIKACQNGKRLLSNLSDLEVKSKKVLNEKDYFRSYDQRLIGGKLLVKPEEFKTSADKKKKESSVVFLPKGSNAVYYSSYGDNPDTGKDIYTAGKTSSGEYGKPQKVPVINTEYDEDYPFLHPDGKTLYFASKGHNSMGGYDIFKSTFNEETNTWGTPVNLEFPINSPDDDFLFVTDSLEQTAWFSTGRQSPPGMIDVLKINTERRPIDIVVITGNVMREKDDQSVSSLITVKESGSGREIGKFQAEDNGDYQLELPNGSGFVFRVETPGMKSQEEKVDLPLAKTSKPYRQTISYISGKLKITNYFDGEGGEDNYRQYLGLIEKKARLEVNEGQNQLPVPAATAKAVPETPVTSVETKTVKTEQEPVAVNEKVPEETDQPEIQKPVEKTGKPEKQSPVASINNNQLAEMAQQDASEARMEAGQLRRDAEDALETGRLHRQEAYRKLSEAEEAISIAGSIPDASKTAALKIAEQLRQDAESERQTAEKIIGYAEKLNTTADEKEKEAALNEEYASELKRSVNATDKQASLVKIEELQKKLGKSTKEDEAEKAKFAAARQELEDKEARLMAAEKSNAVLRTELKDLRNAGAEKETELASARKKAKPAIQTQLDELNGEISEKEKMIAVSDGEIKQLSDEIGNLISSLEPAKKAGDEPVAAVQTNESKAGTATTNLPGSKSLKEKYASLSEVRNPNDKADIESANSQLVSYNNEIGETLQSYRFEMNNTTDKQRLDKLNAEISALEASREQNLRKIESNKSLIRRIDQSVAETPQPPKTEASATAVKDAAQQKAFESLQAIAGNLEQKKSETYNAVNLIDPAAGTKSAKAAAILREAEQREDRLKQEIAATLRSAGGNAPAQSAGKAKLDDDIEKLQARISSLRSDAIGKPDPERERLLAEAKKLEEESRDKQLESAELTGMNNAGVYQVNSENISGLIATGKSTAADIDQARKLNEEAELAFRQAVEIRTESAALPSKGARIGNYANAEEKEAEAVIKQQEAVAILQKANPGYALKSVPSEENTPEKPDINTRVSEINLELNQIAALKAESYKTFFEANEAELKSLQETAKASEKSINAAPGLKTSLINANSRISEAEVLRQQAETSGTNGDKIAALASGLKKQEEAIAQLRELNATAKEQEPITVNIPDEPKVAVIPPVPAATSGDTVPVKAVVRAENTTSEKKLFATKDTTAAQVVSFIDDNRPTLKSPQAGVMFSSAIDRLKEYETEAEMTEIEIKGYDPSNASNNEELRSKADALLTESEELYNRSVAVRSEAGDKTGREQDSLNVLAKELQSRSRDKEIEAAVMKQQANEKDISDNNRLINEMLEKLSNDKPGSASQLEEERSGVTQLTEQRERLAEEADALTNKSAKVGAYGNTEEKDIELIAKQGELIAKLREEYPGYGLTRSSEEVQAEKKEVPPYLIEKKKQIKANQYSELSNLTNAFTLEYETSKRTVPDNLSAEQKKQKEYADNLNAESKRLLVNASLEKNEDRRVKFATLAARSGLEAITQLNKLGSTAPVVPSQPEKEPVAVVEVPVRNTNTEPAPRVASPSGNTVRVEGLEVIAGNAYSEVKPIPIDARIEDGLLFRVQIGAFRTRLPDNSFRGLSPLNGESTPGGFIRYTAGNFLKMENANAVKNDLRGLGYRDAFVVAYYNGKRITIAEAMDLLKKEGREPDVAAPQSAGITANANVPKGVPESSPAPVVSSELERTQGLLYTIQIGVFSRQSSSRQLFNLSPMFSEQLSGGLFRYTAGIYNNVTKAQEDKNRINRIGIPDAFVTAYLGGKRIALSEARDKQAVDPAIKMEKENPVVFGAGENASGSREPAAVTPFRSVATSYPPSTPSNGIKQNEEGISYKVQIGAFSREVPSQTVELYSQIRSWPVEFKQIGNLYIYMVGNFTSASFAESLRNEMISLGIGDAFITVYRDGRKLYGSEAASLLNR